MLASIGKFLVPVFLPLGFGDWRAVTSLATGLTAKEAVVSTLAVLTQSSDAETLAAALSGLFTPLSAYSFLVFSLLYMPCVAAMAAIKRELGSWTQATLAMVLQTGTAWMVAFLFYQAGRLLFL